MRLILLGEQTMLLQGLAKLLHDQCGAEIYVSSRLQSGDMLPLRRPDAILTEMADVTAASVWLKELVASTGGVPVMVIAPGEPEQFLAALRAGARGFISRNVDADQVSGSVRAVVRGEWALPREFHGVLTRAYVTAVSAGSGPELVLSKRERAVLYWLAAGLSTRQIGERVHVSEGTVRADLRVLMSTLGVQRRAQVVFEASRRGLIGSEDPYATA